MLDEPTSSLDLKNQYQVLDIVHQICCDTGITAIEVIHDLNLALRFCDKFLLMKDGKIYCYGGIELLNRKAIEEVYGVNAEIVLVNGQNIVLVD